MNHKIQFTLVLLCIFNFICLSTQYGQVFVDEVQPAKTDVVYFNSATSENAQLGELNVQTLTISHPEGFIVEFPGSLGFGGSSHDLVGELGITFGASTTDSVSLTSTGPFTSLSQTIDISVGSAFIRSYDDMTFQSTRGVSFQSDFFNLDGLFGADIISSEENVNVQSGVEISSHSERIEIAADDQLFIGAKSGTVELQSGATVSSSSESMFLQGLLGTQLVARGNLTVYAEDTFNTYSAESYYSSLTTTSLSSTQNVDFTAADTLIFRSAGSSTVNAQSELYVAANGDDESSVNVISSNAISVGATFANFNAFVVDVDAVEMNIAATILDMTSTERIAFGSDKTSSLFIVSQSDLTFSLADNSLGEISVDSFITELDSTTSSLITAAGDLKVVSSNIKSDATNITFTSNEFTAYSISQTGRLVYSINAGSQLTGNDSSIAARDQVISGQSSVTTTTTGTLNADFVQDLTVSAANDLLFEGSSLTVNAYDISYAAEGSVFVNGGDVSIASVTGPISFDAQNALSVQSASASFTSKYGDIKLQSLGDYSFTTSDSMNYESGDNLDFTAYGLQYSVDAAANLVFSLSSTTAADGYASFVSSLDFTFDAASYSFNAEDLLFAAGLDFSITAQQNVQLTSSDVISLVTLNHNEGGVSFTADQTISATATNGNLTLDSSAALSLSTTDFKIDTNVISFVSSQSITFNAITDLLFDSSTTSIDSTGNLVFATQGTLDLHSSGLLSFLGSGNAYLSFGDLQQTAGMNNQFQSGQLAFTSSAATSMTTQNLNATASNPGQIISITSLLSGISFAAGNWSLQTGNLYVNGENYANSASYSMVVNAGDIALASREFNLASGNFSLNAGSIQYSTDAFLGSFTTSSDQLSLTSAEGVVLTSAGDITWNALKGDITVSTHDLTLKAFNSEGFYAQTDINFVAPGGSNDIEILANGATHLNAGADVTIFSQNDMLWQAQRSLVFRTVVDGIFLFAEQGNFGVDSAASILYEASDAVDLIAYNTNGNASASFLAKDSILLRTTRNGIYFKSEGFVPNSTTVGIELESTALQGDIAFDSNQGTIFIDAPYQITFDSLAKVDLISALYSVYTSKNDMTFDALKGGLNFNALAGVTITAGTPGNPADLSFIQPKSFYAISTSAIDIRSQGPVVGNAIEIKAANGSIEFTTADASDITLTAGNAQTFTAGKSYTIDSNEDIQAYTPGGPIIYNAVTKGSFVTEGGPIQITTQTGSLNGEIDITALTGDITFNSGNTAFFTAKQNMTFDAASSISIAAADGVFEVSASSADSVINAHAAGYIQIQSTGSRLVPYDGIYLEAANNIEIGTITTDTISLNAVNYVIIGDVTRPIVTINAGGSTTVSGITATSDGLISVYTENNLLFDITGELEYTGSSYIKGFSSGPSTYTVQNDIDLSAATGAIKLEADVLQFTATNGIQATTSGDLHVDQYGDARYNKIQISGPKVDFSATQSMTWYDNYVDGDLTDTFTLVTSGAGSIAGLENEGGTMVFHANTLFSIQSGDLLTFTNQRSYGSTLFAATGTNSPITITSDTQSDIEVNSGDQIYTYGLSISYSTDDQLTFEAQDNTPNNDDENGDISFYSSNSINVTSQSDLTFTASQTAAIQTTSFDNEAGYPLDMISTDEFEISSAYNLLIQNTYNEGGSIEFTALSDITIENSNSNGVLVSFYADANLTVETTRDYTLNIPNGGFDQTVGSDISMVANGIDSVDDFGIQFITQSNEGVIDFRALFGSVEFTAQNSLTLSANLNTDTSVASDLEIESGLTGSLTSNGQINVAANNDITFEAYSASIILQSTDNMMFTATSSSSNLAFIANGIDDNGFFGMKFTSTDADASTLLTTSADLNIKSAESLVFEGQMIDMFVVSNIEFDSKFGDILVESAFNLTYLTNSNIEITSATQMEFISAGTVYANSDGSISFATNGDFSNLGVQTYGSDAAIYTYSSGEINFQAYDYFAARTPERVGADINVTSSLGRIEFHSQLDPGAITMNVVSYFGNVTLESTGDDGDIYFYSSYLDIQASGSVIIESTLNLGDTTPGIILNVGTTTTHSAALNYYANSVTFGTNTGNFELTAVDGSVGIQANGNANIYANTGLNFINSGIDTNLNIQAESSSIRFYSTYSTIGTFATESVYPKVKIPHNDKPVTQSSLSYSIYESECFTGEMFYTSNVRVNGVNYINTSTGFLCYCTGSRTLQCAPFLTPSCSRQFTNNEYGDCLPNLLFQHRNA